MKTLTLKSKEALQFIQDKNIALAGASRNPKKFGNVVLRTLKSKGLNIYPINPHTDSIDNEICYRSLKELPPDVKNLLILLKPDDAENVLKEAIRKSIPKVWIQRGSESAEAIKMAKEAGLTLITGKCILMYADPAGFHKLHMRLTRFFGKY